MEILSTSTDLYTKVVICVIATIIALGLIVGAIGGYQLGEHVNATAVLIVGLLFLSLWLIPTNTYYDAIVTDFNEVYEQGYEVVEQNGKIVTLRKVDD